MAYQAPRKKKEWWETALESVGRFADNIIPGDQSSWHTPKSTQSKPVTPTVRNTPTLTVQNAPSTGINFDKPLTVGVAQNNLDTPLTVGTAKPQEIEPIVSPLNTKAIDERLDKGYSWEQISKETGTDLNRVKQYSQKTRPNYGIAPKPEQPKHTFTDYRMEKVGNKKIFGLDVGQYMGDYGDLNKMHVDQTAEMTEDDFLKGFDRISRESAKYNTGKQTRDLYVNKLKEKAEAGDQNAIFTLKTLNDNKKLEGDWTDFLDSANKKFYGGLQQSGARAVELLPGEQGTGEWADRQKELNKPGTKAGEYGETAGQVMRTGLDVGLMITPVGAVDKAVKGTRAVQGLNNWNRGAGFVARTIPGSAVATGMDIGSQELQGNEQNYAQSAALGLGVDLALPVAGRVVSKIPGVEQAGKFVLDQGGNLVRQTGNVIEAGKNNVREIRNSVDDMLDNLVRKAEPPKVTIKSDVPQTTNLTPNTPRSDVKPFTPQIQPETRAGVDNLIARSEATPVPEGMQRVFQSNGAGGNKTNWVFDDVDSLLAYKNNTTNPGDTFEFIDVPKGSLKPTGNGEHVFTLDVAPATSATNKRAIDADATMQRLRERAANPQKQPNIAQQYGLKEETVERLVRDYGQDRARSIIQRSSDATNIRNMDAFVVSEAQKNFGKVPGKVRINNGAPDPDLPPIEAYDTPPVNTSTTFQNDFETLRKQAFDAFDEGDDDLIDSALEARVMQQADKEGYEVFYNEDWGGYMIALKNTDVDIKVAADKIKNLAKDYDFELKVNPDGTIRMYHGTNEEALEAITKGGFEDGTTFLSPSKEVEYGGVNGAGYYGNSIVEVDVDPRKVVFNPSGEFSVEDTSGIVRVLNGAESSVPPVREVPTTVEQLDAMPPVREEAPLEYPTTPQRIREPLPSDAELGKIMETFYDSKKGNQKIRYADMKAAAETAAARSYNAFQEIGSDLRRVAQITQEHVDKGIKNVDEMTGLTPAEKDLWKAVQAEQDYMRRRSSLGGKEIGGDQGDSYWHRVSPDNKPTRETLFEGFRDKKPGSEMKRKTDEFALKADEISYSPQVISKYIIEHGDTKLLQEERIYRAMAKNNPDLDEELIRDAAQDVINLQNRVNNLKTKIKFGVGKKVTVNEGKVIDFADEMNQIGKKLNKPQIEVAATPRGLTNGDRINSVTIDDNGQAVTVGDYLGLNQVRDSSAYAGTQVMRAGNDKEKLAELVAERLNTNYRLPQEDVDYAVQSILNMKPNLPTEVIAARLTGIYRNAGKAQLLERLQTVSIQNKTLRNDVSALANQILREGSIEQELSAKIVQNTLRAQNALFRKLNVSSAINELSDMTSFFTIYGKDLKAFTPDFQLVKQLGLGELDPALEPFLKQIDNGASVKSVLSQINEGTRLYKFVETYKAGVVAKTARDFYSSPKGGSLTGDALTAKILEDYRNFALPVDAFTKTFLDNYPLYTQYMTWGARNLQKEGRLLTGQFDAGLMKDKTTAQRIARDLYANLPAKTVFWLSSNALKGTAIMTAFGLTDFTGLTNQDYSGIAEEDKSFFDRTTQWTNMSTTLSLLNTSIQALEKEHLKQKYADADYNPYENANFGDSFINTYTPQFLKNAMGAYDLQQKGYSEAKSGRVQYEAPEDPWNVFKSFVFGKNQTENAREYSGRENIVDRMAEGVDPFTAMSDMAQEQMGIKEADYNRPISEDYSEAYKAAEEGANTALLEGGRKYNDYLDDLKKNSPDLYNDYIGAMDGNHVSPEYWRNIAQSTDGGVDLTTFKMLGDRKRQLQKDLGIAYDPLYDLPDDQAAAVLRYKSSPTGDDLAVRNMLNKEQWYKDLKERQAAFYDANPSEGGEGFKSTERVKQWDQLDDQLSSFYYDKDSKEVPAWAEQFPAVYEQKRINAQFGFGSPESDAFFKANADVYQAQKEGYDKAQLDVINQMREIEGYPPMSWEAYQQATEIADTDTSDDKSYNNSGSDSGSSISPSANGSYSSVGNSTGAKSIKINKPASVKLIKRGGGAKKISIKRGGTIK